MEFKDYINAGIEKCGSITALAEFIGQPRATVSLARSHKKSLPDEAIFKLADTIKANPSDIIIAKQMALAKTEEKRKFWESYLNKARMISATVCVATFTSFVTTPPASANASTTCVSLNTSNTNYTNHEEGNTGKSWPNLILYAPNLP